MSSKKLLNFDSDDDEYDQSEGKLPINKAFSERYENYRSKEVMQKLKDKYGDQIWESSADEEEEEVSEDESSESDQEEEKELFDENFLRVLGALKSKDADIYNKEKHFFTEAQKTNDDQPSTSTNDDFEKKKTKKMKTEKMDLLDYHKKLLKDKKGVTFEDEELMMDDQQPAIKTGLGYYEELSQIKKELLKAADKGSENEDEDEDDLILGKKILEPLEVKQKKEDPKVILDEKCKEDKYIGELQTFWKSDKLNENERFLRDYIINKEYLKGQSSDEDNKDGKFSDEERSEAEYDSDDPTHRSLVKGYESTKFHHEEADAQVIKSYPRDIESIRDIALKQKKTEKRIEQIERKKQQKEAELKKLRELKRDEIRKKIQLLEKTSGRKLSEKAKNIDLDLLVDDTEFDADKYDERVAALFNEEFYENDNQDVLKPKFEYDSEIDETEYADDVDEGLIADEDEYKGEVLDSESDIEIDQKEEDDDDHDPKLSKKQKLKLKKKEKQQKKLDVASNKSFGIYEDVIGGQGVRFKYRKTTPNTFGLTMEEILFADDDELNRWCSLKKSQQFEDDEQERQYFENKGANISLKKKILKSLYGSEEEKQRVQKLTSDNHLDKKKKRKHKKKKQDKEVNSKEHIQEVIDDQTNDQADDQPIDQNTVVENPKADKPIVKAIARPKNLPHGQNNKNKRKRKRTNGLDQQRLSAYGINQNSFKKKKKNV